MEQQKHGLYIGHRRAINGYHASIFLQPQTDERRTKTHKELPTTF
jgi:hypothetical protein